MISSPFQPGMEGPRSSATVPKEERILSKEGLEDKEERDSYAPEGLPFKKQCRSSLMYSAFTLTFSAMF